MKTKIKAWAAVVRESVARARREAWNKGARIAARTRARRETWQ